MRTRSAIISKRSLALIAVFVSGLLFFRHVWPGSFLGAPPLVSAWTPYLAWLPPFVVYALWPPFSGRLRQKAVAGIANALLLVAYHFALKFLGGWQDQRFRDFAEQCRNDPLALACPAGMPTLYPPPPPAYWEWAAAAYFAALAGLYILASLDDRRG